jgi:hypothetical protein
MDGNSINGWKVFSGMLLVVLFLLGVYVGGYFALSKYVLISSGKQTKRCRDFPNNALAVAFRPCAWVESAVTGENVDTSCMSDFWRSIQ